MTGNYFVVRRVLESVTAINKYKIHLGKLDDEL